MTAYIWRQNVFKAFIDPDRKTPIDDCTYDVVLCCAGFFDGLISPRALKELARITKPSGLIIWNIADGGEFSEYDDHASIVDGLVADGIWKYAEPVKKIDNLVFSDSGRALLGGYDSSGLATLGLVYTMRKCAS